MSREFSELLSETKGLVLRAIGETLIERFEEHTEDVFQEVYFRAFKALKKKQFRGDSKVSTWLYTIAKNESNRMNAKCLKEEAKQKKYFEEKTVQLALVSKPTNEISLTEAWKVYLDSVPEPFQESFRLFLQGKKISEIGNLLDVHQNTIKTRIFRAKLYLRKIFNSEKKVGKLL